jgi:hypothetical protein
MDAELEKLVEAGKLTTKSAGQLEKLTPGTFCLHKSWGFGRVREWNLLLNQIVIDFATKKSHPMQAQYAAENVMPSPQVNGHCIDEKTGPGESGGSGAKHFGKPRRQRQRTADRRLADWRYLYRSRVETLVGINEKSA